MNDYGERASFLMGLRRAPDGSYPPGTDMTVYDSVWGFTVYRTAYEPASELKWQALLDDIRADVVEQFNGRDGKYQADHTTQRILSLFHLDIRSDPAVLDGLNMDDLRKVYKDADWKERKFFLLVDQEVLDAPRKKPDKIGYKSWVKCVDVEYLASDWDNPRNKRAGPQVCFGWMKLATSCVPQLWFLLGSKWLDSLAPPVREGTDVEVWDEGEPFS
jgi:hypothetical protein